MMKQKREIGTLAGRRNGRFFNLAALHETETLDSLSKPRNIPADGVESQLPRHKGVTNLQKMLQEAAEDTTVEQAIDNMLSNNTPGQ